jgi:hypothetical protein
MRITTFDLDDHKPCAIDVSLRRLAASAEPLKAASWQKLLDLVTHLQSRDSEHELWGQIVLQELLLHKPEPSDPVRDMQMKRFMDEWRALNPDPATWGDRRRREMRRRFPTQPGVRVSVRVHWRDYAPLRDGLPELHYRFQVRRPGKTITEDARANDVVEAERIICAAFGW